MNPIKELISAVLVLSQILVCYSANHGSENEIDYGVPQGFPAVWNGDAYNHTNCRAEMVIPTWLDGYFFCQTLASYGDQSNPPGQKIMHMFDAISAVALFDINPVQSTFSAAYYPVANFKIWDLYNRDLEKSTVAWGTAFTPYNNSQRILFNKQLSNMNYLNSAPNVDFWKIGTSIVAGTETYELGLTFDVPTLTDFERYPFVENNTYFGKGKDPDTTYMALHMPIHERVDLATGLLWNSAFTVKTPTKQMFSQFDFHELLCTVDGNGTRNIVADYDGYKFDISKCNYKTGKYEGNPSTLPGYMHSTTSTENYFILPLTSNVFNPCIFNPYFPTPGDADVIWYPNSTWPFYVYSKDANLRFLLFDKRNNNFIMVHHDFPQFVTHQANAYEVNETTVVIDMVTYDDNAYSALDPEEMMHINSESFDSTGAHFYRFTLDLVTNTSTNETLVPEDPVSLEFPQFNHAREGLKYKWTYILYGGYAKNSSIWKVDMDDHSGKNNLIFHAGFNVSLAEPYFVASPTAKTEDEGVLVVRGLDISVNKSRVYIVDALTMRKQGELLAPDIVPFGFHNRYYSKKDLNLPIDILPTPPPPRSGSVVFYAGHVLHVVVSVLIFIKNMF